MVAAVPTPPFLLETQLRRGAQVWLDHGAGRVLPRPDLPCVDGETEVVAGGRGGGGEPWSQAGAEAGRAHDGGSFWRCCMWSRSVTWLLVLKRELAGFPTSCRPATALGVRIPVLAQPALPLGA